MRPKLRSPDSQPGASGKSVFEKILILNRLHVHRVQYSNDTKVSPSWASLLLEGSFWRFYANTRKERAVF